MNKGLLIILLPILQGCTYLIHNEYYQFIDRSKTIYDAAAFVTDKETSTETLMNSIKPKIKRVTVLGCGSGMYSDYPCMEAKGCILLND